MLRRIVLKQGSHPVVRMVYQRDGRGKGPVVCAFRRHSLTRTHTMQLTKNLPPTIAGGNDACGKIGDSWAELLIGRS